MFARASKEMKCRSLKVESAEWIIVWLCNDEYGQFIKKVATDAQHFVVVQCLLEAPKTVVDGKNVHFKFCNVDCNYSV